MPSTMQNRIENIWGWLFSEVTFSNSVQIKKIFQNYIVYRGTGNYLHSSHKYTDISQGDETVSNFLNESSKSLKLQ